MDNSSIFLLVEAVLAVALAVGFIGLLAVIAAVIKEGCALAYEFLRRYV